MCWLFLVLNPSVRMSWIVKHWEPEEGLSASSKNWYVFLCICVVVTDHWNRWLSIGSVFHLRYQVFPFPPWWRSGKHLISSMALSICLMSQLLMPQPCRLTNNLLLLSMLLCRQKAPHSSPFGRYIMSSLALICSHVWVSWMNTV